MRLPPGLADGYDASITMSPILVTATRPSLDAAGLAGLGRLWQGLQEAAGASAFQCWAWVGCLAGERYPDPVLVQAHRDGVLHGLALFNRRGGRLWLHEGGDPVLDSVFIEHNGPLVLPGPARDAVLDAMLRFARRGRQVVLSGVDGAVAASANRVGGVYGRQDRVAPCVRFDAVPPGTDYLAGLSANTRQQLRRSARAYGDLALDRAGTEQQALMYLDGLIDLHQTSWRDRGKPGAFAAPEVRRFHGAMMGRGVASGMVDLLRIRTGADVVGYLYNLRAAGWVCAYQSGFDYAAAPRHGKPGLTCHHLAIEAARADGAACYDFLGGMDRYKESLANARQTLHWLRIGPPWHPRVWMGRMHGMLDK